MGTGGLCCVSPDISMPSFQRKLESSLLLICKAKVKMDPSVRWGDDVMVNRLNELHWGEWPRQLDAPPPQPPASTPSQSWKLTCKNST